MRASFPPNDPLPFDDDDAPRRLPPWNSVDDRTQSGPPRDLDRDPPREPSRGRVRGEDVHDARFDDHVDGGVDGGVTIAANARTLTHGDDHHDSDVECEHDRPDVDDSGGPTRRTDEREWVTRLRRIDQAERRVERERRRASRRRTGERPPRRDRPADLPGGRRTGVVDPRVNDSGSRDAVVPRPKHRGRRSPQRRAGYHVRPQHLDHGSRVDLATQSTMSRRLGSNASGLALAAYVALLPYVVWTKWHQSGSTREEVLIRAILVALTVLWLGFLVQVGRNMATIRRGGRVRAGGTAWIAGVLLAIVSFLHVPTTSAPHRATPVVRTLTHRHGHSEPVGHGLALTGVIPMALAARRRLDDLRRGESLHDIDGSIELLRHHQPDDLARLAALAGDEACGVIDVPEDLGVVTPRWEFTPLVALALDDRHVAFAREGGSIPIPSDFDEDELVRRVTALHDGPVEILDDVPSLVRSLATRSVRRSIVVYTGDPSELDGDLVASCVTISRTPRTASDVAVSGTGVLVQFLRAEPQVLGLAEPFTPTLRRRCVEMAAYLAVHRREPVTGDRLRTRVLSTGDSDASLRTLANTASALRRSLGVDDRGPRLHPVSSAGLYATHGVYSDIERFGDLVAQGRRLEAPMSASLARSALELVHGEVLASTLRGFEWFVAEGHAARLARDGEWAALMVHHHALAEHEYDLAFWAVQQGLLIDPYSDALREALAQVPRLREFGRDRRSGAKDQPVRAGRTVAVSWSYSGFVQQITQ